MEWQKLQRDVLRGKNNPLALPDGASPTDPHVPGTANRDKREAGSEGGTAQSQTEGERKEAPRETNDLSHHGGQEMLSVRKDGLSEQI